MSKTFEGPRGVDLLQSETLELLPSAARTATPGTNGTAFVLNGERVAFGILLKITNKATDAADTLDVYIDFLGPDGVTWINAVHFTQAKGNEADAESQYVQLIPNTGSTAPTVVTGDAASGVVRPEVTGSQIRARYAIVDADANGTFSFGVWATAL